MKQVFPTTIQSGASQTGNYILMLQEPESGSQVPIIIGPFEAQSILLAHESDNIRRPMTHRMMHQMMETFGLTLQEVTIDRVMEGVFYATLHVSDGFNRKQIDSRTTDAIALALHANAPILMDEKVLEECGVKVESKRDACGIPGRAGEGAKRRVENGERSVAELEEDLRRCEEAEDYERAAEIQKQIEKVKNCKL